MKFRMLFWLSLVAFLGIFCVLAGCTESDGGGSSSMRQARLVANENLELKEELKDRDSQIKTQERLLAECEQKISEKEEAAHKSGVELLELMMVEVEKSTKLAKENEELKARIKELESK